RRNGWWKPALLALGLAGLIVLDRSFHLVDRLRELHHWIASLGPWGGPAAYTLLFALGTLLALPGSAMTLVAGLFFDVPRAVAVSALGSSLGSSATFLLARTFARRDLARWASRDARFRKLDRLTERHGAWIVALLRLMPLSPFSVLNYAFGLTRVRFSQYALWSFLCTLPGTFFFVLSARALAQGVRQHRIPWGSVAALVGVTVLLACLMAWVEKRVMARPGR
ncbi:MAG TPA: TVP38/TMEM64 family protein, partial [bacterium]|nr:TVP38/TMEM64 family protein [bacterium]